MLASLKKRVRETDAVPPTMEGAQSSASLQDPSPSPLEVLEESIPREQPPGSPRTESLDTEIILQHFRESQAGQDSLLSEMAELRTSIGQMNHWLKKAESRLSSLEARARESQQTNSTMLASQSEPMGEPTAPSSSFCSQQMIWDAAQTAASPSCTSAYTGDVSTEPAPPSSSEQFRTTSRSTMYSETEEKAYQMLADAWPLETNLEGETTHIKVEKSDNQEDTFARTSPLMAPECKTDTQILTSTEQRALPMITAVRTLKRSSESGTAHIKVEESDNQEDTYARASPLMAPERKTDTQTLTSTEEAALPVIPAECFLERTSEGETSLTAAAEETDQEEDTSSRSMPSLTPEYERDPHPSMSTEVAAQPMIPAERFLERISEGEAALTKAEETDQEEDNSSRPMPSLVPEYETDPHPWISTEEARLIAAVGAQERTAESEAAHTEPAESYYWENKFSGTSPQACKPEQQPLMNTLPEIPQPAALTAMQEEATGIETQSSRRCSTQKRYSSTALTSSTTSGGTPGYLAFSSPTEWRPPTKCRQTSIAWQYFTKRSEFIATCDVCKTDLRTGKEGGSHWGTVTLLAHLKRMHGIAQNKVAPSVFHGAGSEIQDAKRPFSTERPSRTTLVASAFTASSPGTLRGISSSPPADVKPPTKRRRRTSIAWQYFMKQSKFMATCNLCEKNVQTGTVGGNWGTGALLRHLKREHGIPQEKVAPSVFPGGGSKNQDVNRLSTTERPNRTTLVASASTVTSPETLRGLSSSDVRPPTNHGRRTSIAWKYFMKRSKFMATCSLCEEDVQIGNIGSNWGTVGLLRHLKRKHGVHREKVAQSVSPRAKSEIQDVKGHSTTERPSRTTSAASTCTASSSRTLSCHSSSPTADVRPPTNHGRRRSIAWKYFLKRSKFMATCSLCEEDVQTGNIGGNWGTVGLLRHLKRKHGVHREKVAQSVSPRAKSEIQDAKGRSTTERPSRTTSAASICTASSSGTLSCHSSSPTADVRPPTKRQRRRSIAWKYFTKQSKFMATCNLCGKNVQTGKVGGCSNWGTSALLLHLKSKHGIAQKKGAPSVLPGARSEIQDAERPSTTEKPSRTTLVASPSTTTSPVTLSCPPSSPPAEVRPATKHQKRTSIAWQYFTKQSKLQATCNLCEEDVHIGKRGGCGNVGTSALLRHLKRKHGIHREKVAPSVLPGAGSKIQDVKGPSTTERPSRTTPAASTCTASSSGTLSCYSSSPAAEVRAVTKHRRTSVAWRYFTSQSKFKATCNLCGMDVQTGKIGGCGNVGTAALLSHLKRKHGITQKKVAPSGLPAVSSKIQEVKRPSTTERSSRTKPRWASIAWLYFTSQSRLLATCNLCEEVVQTGKIRGYRTGGAAALLRHLKDKHGIPQEKVAPSVLPGGGSKNQDVNRPSSTERPSRTTLIASACNATFSGPSSSPPADVRPPTKCRGQTSIAWQYFTKLSKFTAACNLCEKKLETGKVGGCSNWGTSKLLRHLKHKHEIPQEKVAPSVLPGGGSKNQDVNRPSSTERPSRTTLIASAGNAALSGPSSSTPADVRPPTKSQGRTSIAWQYFTKLSMFTAACNLCEKKVQTGKVGGCSNWGTSELLRHLKHKHGIPQEKVAPSVLPGGGSKNQDVNRLSTTERPNRTTLVASASTASSPGTLRGLSSSPPADLRPPTKHRRRRSIAWKYFTRQSKFMATCNLCEKNVQTGKVGGCSNWGTSALLLHLRCKHGIPQKNVAPSVLPGSRSEIQDAERPSTIERPSGTTLVASPSTTTPPVTLSCLLSSPPAEVRPATKHQKPSVLPGARSEIQDAERPSTIERSSRTTLVASPSTTTPPVTLSCLLSSPPAEVRPATKHQKPSVLPGARSEIQNPERPPSIERPSRTKPPRTSIAWRYFTRQSKFKATCNLCAEDVQTGKTESGSSWGTTAMLRHLKREHGIPQEKVASSVLPTARSEIQDLERPSTTERPSRTTSDASTCSTALSDSEQLAISDGSAHLRTTRLDLSPTETPLPSTSLPLAIATGTKPGHDSLDFQTARKEPGFHIEVAIPHFPKILKLSDVQPFSRYLEDRECGLPDPPVECLVQNSPSKFATSASNNGCVFLDSNKLLDLVAHAD